MTIKKAFLELHTMLVANEDKKVKTIMPDLVEIMSAKGAGGGASSVHRGEDGSVLAIMDYYFKVWLPVEFVEYGAKANSASGLNTMCKLGTSLWTKQQREFKKGKETLLEDVAAGDVLPTEIQGKLDELEEARGYITAYPVPELVFTSTEDFDNADRETMVNALAEYEAYLAAEAAEAAADTE